MWLECMYNEIFFDFKKERIIPVTGFKLNLEIMLSDIAQTTKTNTVRFYLFEALSAVESLETGSGLEAVEDWGEGRGGAPTRWAHSCCSC